VEEVLPVLIETPLLASAADREFTSTQLQQHVGAGRLTLDEFSERAAAVYRARTIGELQALLRDLPIAPVGPASSSSRWQRWAGIVVLLLVTLIATALLLIAGHVGSMNDMMGGGMMGR